MNTSTDAITNDLSDLAKHARELISATADVAGEKVAEARQSLSNALDSGKEMACQARDRAVNTAKAACDCARAHPLQAMGIAIGIAAVLVMTARLCIHRRA